MAYLYRWRIALTLELALIRGKMQYRKLTEDLKRLKIELETGNHMLDKMFKQRQNDFGNWLELIQKQRAVPATVTTAELPPEQTSTTGDSSVDQEMRLFYEAKRRVEQSRRS
mmetsp:Transcript_58434/g.137699  ORF Transcript_58434/g.137699 Transcript_58434/m.137699 type:complete len:112 (+) Transcript_58434:594-929(+)